MKSEHSINYTDSISLRKYVAVLFLISVPFWLLGAYAKGLSRFLPAGLPISALQLICPLITVAILSRFTMTPDERKRLWLRVIRPNRLRPLWWCIPALLVMPLAIVASLVTMGLLGWHVPAPHVDLGAIILMYVIYSVATIGEEVGWTTYLTDPLQSRYGALGAAIVIGSVWSVWHFIPWAQGGHTLSWILAQGAVTLLARIFMVWIYNNSGHSLISSLLFHASINVAQLFPTNGPSLYHPEVTSAVLIVAAVLVIWKFGPRTLTAPSSTSSAR
jgi:uncharacterized protein